MMTGNVVGEQGLKVDNETSADLQDSDALGQDAAESVEIVLPIGGVTLLGRPIVQAKLYGGDVNTRSTLFSGMPSSMTSQSTVNTWSTRCAGERILEVGEFAGIVEFPACLLLPLRFVTFRSRLTSVI